MKTPRLRDARHTGGNEPYPRNAPTREVVVAMGKHIAYCKATRGNVFTGDDWAEAFAYAVGGHSLSSPLGIAGVPLDGIAWSLKTIKNKLPFEATVARLIVGRCSPDYSYGIYDPHKDVAQTGKAVLGIWNERVNIAEARFRPLRMAILVRSEDLTQFTFFEGNTLRYSPAQFVWEWNVRGNLEARDVATGKHVFTWQPHGAQLTLHQAIPPYATRFTLRCPGVLDRGSILRQIGFDESWVGIVPDAGR